MRVVLGNRNAIHQIRTGVDADGRDQTAVVALEAGKRATVVEIPDEVGFASAFVSITAPTGVWANHATDGTAPAWVASDNASLATLLAEHFGGIEIRALEDPFEAPEEPQSPAGGAAAAAGSITTLMLALPAVALLTLTRLSPLLRTTVGADFQAAQMAGTASATAVAKWMALTANATAPSTADTSLTGEIATAGGGLIRQAAVYAHTTGTSSYTLTGTFTANGSDALPVTVAKAGVFNASASGTLVFEDALPTTATLSASGDVVTVTQTVTL